MLSKLTLSACHHLHFFSIGLSHPSETLEDATSHSLFLTEIRQKLAAVFRLKTVQHILPCGGFVYTFYKQPQASSALVPCWPDAV